MSGFFLFIIATALLPLALVVLEELFWWFSDRGAPGVIAMLVLLTIFVPFIGIPVSALVLYSYFARDDGVG